LLYSDLMSGTLKPKNIAYIDGQNLYISTAKNEPRWSIDLSRFRVYLREKYNVERAYYYLGYVKNDKSTQKLYAEIQAAGYALVFRQHGATMLGKKKGNVDSDIIFSIMKRLYLKENFDNIVLVSGDGDYMMLVDFLIEENKFEKILFPNRRYRSSLYKKLSNKFFAYLDNFDTRMKIQKQNKKGALGN
jgi:uncharacterized LabA/DUF88 family protein